MINVAMSDKPRIKELLNTSQELQDLVESNQAFALDLYHAIRKQDENLFFSPYSISQALAMMYAGARGQTEAEMSKILHITLPQDRLHSANNSLSRMLARRGENGKGEDGTPFRLDIVNGIWGQQDYTFLPDYLDILAQHYGTGIYILDFINAPEPSRLTINEWISEQTENKINDLLPAGSIDELTRLVLTNAIYFNAAWDSSFKEVITTPDKYYLLDGSTIEVQMMKQTDDFGYSEGKNYQAVELPYNGRDFSMVVLLPKKGKFNVFEKSLNHEKLTRILDGINSREIILSMPKFKYNMSVGLREVLSSMGMPAAFSSQADFSGINGNRDLSITDVIHKSFISVDEDGTEAAAATASVLFAGLGFLKEPVEVTINRPFVFVIRDTWTGAVLFIGRVLNPIN